MILIEVGLYSYQFDKIKKQERSLISGALNYIHAQNFQTKTNKINFTLMPTTIDSELVQRLKRDDIKALGELYELLSKKIYNRCYFILKNQDLAEDATQDVFLKAFSRVKTLKDDSKIGPWLNRIAYNYCIDKIREIKRERNEINQLETTVQLENLILELDKISESERFVAELKVEIERLSESERLIIILYYWDGLGIAEIAKQLDLGESAVKMKLSRTRSKLKVGLSDKGVDHALEVSIFLMLNLL